MREGNAINVILINKDPDERAELSVMLKSVGQLGHVSLQQLSADGLFIHSKGDASLGWTESEIVVEEGRIEASLLPHSISTLLMEFR